MNTTQKRLAFFLPGLYGGGAERIMLNLAKGISERGYPVDLILARAEGPYLAEIPVSVRLIDLKAARVLSSAPALIRYLRQERPAALLSALHANVVSLLSWRVAGVPFRVVVSEHNTLSYVVSGTPDLRWQIFPQFARLFYPWAGGIVAVSNGVAEDLAKTAKIRRDRIQTIYNPIVTPDLQEKSQAPLDHPWFGAGEPPVLLAVGRLTAQKAFDLLIQAFAKVRKTHSTRLLILGEGEERPALEALVKQLGLEKDVSLPGFAPNPYAYMARAALFVLSSKWEGLPTVIVEAMSFGTPIVATDCPSGPREILRDGQYGQLVPVGDTDALANAIAATLDGKTPRPPREGWQPFELNNIVEQYLNVLLGN
jgi:glycosyltransferase involved in cell wall biosynthesis